MTGGFDGETLRVLSARFDVPRLVQMLNVLQRTGADLARSANRRTDMELCLVTLCDPTLDTSPAGLNARLARLEQGEASAPAPGKEVIPARKEPSPEEVPWEEPPLRDEDAVPEWKTLPMLEPVLVKGLETVPKPPAQAAEAELISPPQAVKAEPAPAARKEMQSAPAASGSWPGWPAFRAQLKGVLAVSDYSLIGSDAMAQGRWDGQELTLWVTTGFVKTTLEKSAVIKSIAELAGRVTGVPARVSVKEGIPPVEDIPSGEALGPASPPPDALDAFLAQAGDNIVVE